MVKDFVDLTPRHVRRRTDMGASLRHEAGSFEVRVRDLSSDGVRISPGHWLARGSAVLLLVEDEDVAAIVHWSTADAAGLRFVERVSGDVLRKLEASGGDVWHRVSRLVPQDDPPASDPPS